MEKFIEKASVLIEALPYMQQFRGETVVVKFGGSIMESEDGYSRILQDIAFTFVEVVKCDRVLVGFESFEGLVISRVAGHRRDPYFVDFTVKVYGVLIVGTSSDNQNILDIVIG